MRLFVLLSLAMVAGLAEAASPGLSHVVRVGRNGRQVVRNKVAGGGQGGGKRRVVRRKQNKPRQSRQFFSPAPAPLTFALPPPPPSAPLRVAPAPLRVAPAPLRVAPAPLRVAPAAFTAFNPFRAVAAPLAPPVRVAPAPFLAPVRVAPLPLAAHHHVQVAHLAHPAPAPLVVPAPAPAPLVVPAPAPAPVPAPAVEVEVVDLRAVPVQREYGAPSTVAPEVRNTYLAPEVEEVEVEVARDVDTGYLAPVEEVVEVEELAPVEEEVEVEAARDVEESYLAPQESYIAVPETTTAGPVVVEAKTSYIAALPSASVEQYVPRTKEVRPEPIGIVRFNMNSPAERKEFDYSFEAENGHKQEAVGTMRRVDDTDVAVMKGSYEYVGSDGLTYVVEWYADETGFHPTARHLPQPVVPNHPEVAAAVRAQIEFAAQEDAAAAAASRSSNTYLAPEELPGYTY